MTQATFLSEKPAGRRRLGASGLLLLAAALGTALALYATSRGAELSADSWGYVQAARNLAAGRGLTVSGIGELVPLTHFPPLFPLILALPVWLGLDVLPVARYLNAILLGVNGFLLGRLLFRHVESDHWLPAAAALVLVTEVAVLQNHAALLSEPLFVFWFLLSLLWLQRYLRAPDLRVLLVSAAWVGLALLTRYAGAGLWAFAILVLLLLGRGTWRARLRGAAIFGLAAALPLALWLGRNALLGQNVTNRRLSFHPVVLDYGRAAWIGLTAVFTDRGLPPATLAAVLLLIVIAVNGVALTLVRRQRRAGEPAAAAPGVRRYFRPVTLLLCLFTLTYLVFIALSMTFVDASTTPSSRILQPVRVAAVGVVLAVLYDVARGLPRLRYLVWGLVGLLLLSNVAGGLTWAAAAHKNGLGYARPYWQESPLIAAVQALPEDAVIFTNANDVVSLLTGRAAYGIPEKTSRTALAANEAYEAELAQLAAALTAGNSYLVWHEAVDWRWYLPTEDDLRAQIPLTPLVQTADGTIYVSGSD